MKVSAVVVSHGHAAELERSLPALRPQVDELLVVANVPEPAPDGVRVLQNAAAARVRGERQRGIAAATGEYVLLANPDAVPEPGAVAELVAFADAHPRCGVVGPARVLAGRPLAAEPAPLPDGARARSAAARRCRLLRSPYQHRPRTTGRGRPSRCKADWMLGGAFLLMRRTMLDELGGWDAGFRHYVEDIDLAYRAAQAGWERWLVPAAVVTPRVRGRDRQALALPAHALAPARDGPLPAQAPREAQGAVTRWSDDDQYADAPAYFARRAELVVSVGPRLERGDTVLDLACADGRLAEFLEPYGIGYRGVDVEPGAWSSRRAPTASRREVGDLNDYVPPAPVTATLCFRAIYYSRDRAAFFRHVAGYTTGKLVFDLNPRQYPLETIREELLAAGFAKVEARPLFAPQRVKLPRVAAWALRALERSGPLARLALRYRFTYVVAASREPSDALAENRVAESRRVAAPDLRLTKRDADAEAGRGSRSGTRRR